jgi:hypothetical protein
MAASRKTKSDEGELPTLVHPDGREYVPASAQEANRLVTSEGYRLQDDTAELPDAFAEGVAKLKAGRPSDGLTASDGGTADAGTSRTGTDTARKAADAPANKADKAPTDK